MITYSSFIAYFYNIYLLFRFIDLGFVDLRLLDL